MSEEEAHGGETAGYYHEVGFDEAVGRLGDVFHGNRLGEWRCGDFDLGCGVEWSRMDLHPDTGHDDRPGLIDGLQHGK